MVIRPPLSNSSRPLNTTVSATAGLRAALIVPSFVNKSTPPPNSLVKKASNNAPALLLKVSLLSVRSTKPLMTPFGPKLVIAVDAPIVSIANNEVAVRKPELLIVVDVFVFANTPNVPPNRLPEFVTVTGLPRPRPIDRSPAPVASIKVVVGWAIRPRNAPRLLRGPASPSKPAKPDPEAPSGPSRPPIPPVPAAPPT